ncbi:universal stress protein [Actinomycetospora sp. C-140]
MTGGPDGGAIVVGVALAGRGAPAVRWAAAEAEERGASLRLVCALVPPRGSYPGRSVVGVDAGEALLAAARRELHAMRAVAREVAPGPVVDETLIESGPIGVLRAQARTAAAIVIGTDRFGLAGELLMGGIARGLVGHVDVPVVVVPGDDDAPLDGRAVVVGDDGTPGSRGALRFAADRAARRRTPLVVVRAGRDARTVSEEPPELGADGPPAVHVVVAEDRVDRVLADQARDAELVVLGVGAHGRWHPVHSTRRTLLRRTSCPVVVVPPGTPAGTRPEPARAAGRGAPGAGAPPAGAARAEDGP